MGAEHSQPKSEVTPRCLELALENQRKLYETQTKMLLDAQREALTKDRDKPKTNQVTSKPENAHTPPVVPILYPNLPVQQNVNPFIVQSILPTAPYDHYAETQNRYSVMPSASSLTTQSNQMQFSSDNRCDAPRQYNNRQLNNIQQLRYNNIHWEPCLNRPHGCILRFHQNQMQQHLLECPYNDMICPMNNINGCSWTGKFGHLKEHFGQLHPQCLRIEVNKEETMHIAGNYRILSLITIGPFNFLLHCIVDQRTKLITVGIQLIGSKVSAEKWTFQFRVYNKKSPRKLFEYVDTCHSNTVPLHMVLEQSAVMSLDYAKTFAHEDIITYKLYLKNKEWIEKRLNDKKSGS